MSALLAQPVSAAKGSARTIAHALGGKRTSDGVFICRCPVPGHGRGAGDRNPSLLVSDGDHAVLVKCFGGCDSRDVLDELRRRGLLDDRAERVRMAPKRREKSADVELAKRRHDIAAWLWQQRQAIAGTPAEIYLREARGITCPLPPTLGYLPPSAKYPQPTMIAAFGLCDEPDPGELAPPRNVTAVHLTKLRADGRGKADVETPKIVLGSPGALPIVLAPPNDLLGLAIAEGIEDALAVHEATGLGSWASASAPFLPKLAAAIQDYVTTLTIVVDADDAGRRNSRELATLLRGRKPRKDERPVEIILQELR